MINILSTSPICEVTMSDWSPVSNTIETLEYALVVNTFGEATYQATGLLIKPYFLNTDLLKLTYDSGNTTDSGKVYF
jgi:hypothetical protein